MTLPGSGTDALILQLPCEHYSALPLHLTLMRASRKTDTASTSTQHVAHNVPC